MNLPKAIERELRRGACWSPPKRCVGYCNVHLMQRGQVGPRCAHCSYIHWLMLLCAEPPRLQLVPTTHGTTCRCDRCMALVLR